MASQPLLCLRFEFSGFKQELSQSLELKSCRDDDLDIANPLSAEILGIGYLVLVFLTARLNYLLSQLLPLTLQR